MADEVDSHQVRPVSHTGGGEHSVDGSAGLVDGGVDRFAVPEMHGHEAVCVVSHWRIVHDDYLGAQRCRGVGGRGTHPCGPAHDEH